MQLFKQDDQSDYLIHLVGKVEPYETFMSILWEGLIRAKNNFGYLRPEQRQKSVCFSEIPPQYLQKLVNRRYNQGIAFKKDWLLEQGAQRVWYLEKNSKIHASLNFLANSLKGQEREKLLDLAPFIDISGKYGATSYRFEWEREWRFIGDLGFTPDDVAFLIIPGEKHDLARDFFADAEIMKTGPNYNCPYYDPLTDTMSN